jgi:hypothetical protein
MLTGFSRQREQVCSERRPRRLSLAVEHLNDLRSNQLLGRDMEPVCVALYGVEQSGSRVAQLAQQCGGRAGVSSRASVCRSSSVGVRGGDAVGSDEGVWVAVADDLQVEVVGGPAAGEHGVELLARLLVGEQAVHGVGDDALGGVDGGGVAETGRGSDVVGVRSDRVVVAGVPDSQLGVKARPVGRPRSGAALTPIPAGASFGWRAARSGCRTPHILLGNRTQDLRITSGSIGRRWPVVWCRLTLASLSSPWLVTADDGRSGAQWGHGSDVEASEVKHPDVVCIRAIESEKASPLDPLVGQ